MEILLRMNSNKPFRIPISSYLVILILGMVFFGLTALLVGKDLDWDLANYHYSNPYLFLHHHIHQDFWPASYFHVYLTPTADFLSYFLINYFSPFKATFISGAIHGINFWLIFLICHLLLEKNINNIGIAIFLSFIGMLGAIGCNKIGNFKNDHIVSLFVLIFIYYHIHFLRSYSNKNKWLFFLCVGSLSLGIALGLKLTAAAYVLSAFVTYFFLNIPWKDRWRIMVLSGIACFIGVSLSSGYWLLMMWKQHHNPIFPFLNNIFHSPDFSKEAWHFQRFVPTTFLATLLYPFYFSFHGTLVDGHFRDLRYAFLYCFLIITFVMAVWKKISRAFYKKMDLDLYWLLLFFTFTYIFGQADFGSIRYILTLEMLSPLLIYLLVQRLIENKKLQNIFMVVLFSILVISLVPNKNDTRIASYKGSYFSVIPPTFANTSPNATVLMSYSEFAQSSDPRPTAFLMGFLPANWHFIGIPFQKGLYDLEDKKAFRKTYEFINHQGGTFYLLAPQINMNELYLAALQFNLIASGNCEVVDNLRARLLMQEVWMCPVAPMVRFG
jgi:hypothetical protein